VWNAIARPFRVSPSHGSRPRPRCDAPVAIAALWTGNAGFGPVRVELALGEQQAQARRIYGIVFMGLRPSKPAYIAAEARSANRRAGGARRLSTVVCSSGQ